MSDFDMDSAVSQIGSDLFGSSDPEPSNQPASEPAQTESQPEPTVETSTQSTSEVPGTPGEPAAPETVETEPTNDPEPSSIAPKTWRKEAAAEFAALPQIVRDEIAKREEDMFKGLEGYKQNAQIGQNFATLVKPFEQYFGATGVNPYDEIHGLLGMAYTSKFGTPQQKMDLLLSISSDMGLDLLDAADAQASRPPVSPEVRALQTELNQLKSTRQNEDSQRQAEAKARADAQIEAFTANGAHPYFDEVSRHMAALIQAGICQDLEEAYTQAVQANPVTRAKESSRLAAESKAQSDAKIAAAKKASAANLQTANRQASATTPLGSIDDTLEETLRAIRSRN